MTNIILSLALAALCALPSLAPALEVPAGKAAIIEAVIGKVSVTVAKKETKAQVGQALDFGSVLSTGINGRLSLRHGDNAVTRLAPNTELTLKAPGAKKGIFLSLKQGLIRFLVGQRAPGESFEVSTSNAVAAVKGTDAEVGTDGKTTETTVYGSEHEKAMELLDSISGKSILLSPGQSAGLGGEGFQRRELSRDDFKRSAGNYEGLPKPEVDGAKGNEEGDDLGAKNEANAEAALDTAEAISEAFSDTMEDLGLDSFLERDDRTGDLVAGRIVYDRFGTRTQVSSYIVHNSDNTLLKATYSKRETGEFAGVSYAEEETTWNQALPEDWTTVAHRSVADPANLDLNGDPIYWLTSQYFLAGNPQGDLMEVLRDYQRPYYNGYFDGNGYVRDPMYSYLMDQGYSQGLYLNGTPVHYMEYLYQEEDATPGVLTASSLLTYGDLSAYSNFGEQPGPMTFFYTHNGTNPNGDGIDTFLTTELRVLDNAGAIQNLWDFAGEPTYLRDFRGIDNAFNIELTFSSPYLSAPIDLMVIPEFFDNTDFFDVPTTYMSNGCGCCC